MRSLTIGFVFCLLVACNRDDGDAPLRGADGAPLSNAGGEVSLSDGSRLKFVITSERYKQWESARGGLTKAVVARFGALLKPKSPSEQSIARATAYLESDVTAKQSIEKTGMTVRDFVLMTVALDQEMQLASGRASPASAQPSTPQPYNVDTAYELPTVPRSQVAPMPERIDSTYRRDSLPAPRPVDPPRRDTASPPKPDSARRDSVPAPKPDSARDTTSVADSTARR